MTSPAAVSTGIVAVVLSAEVVITAPSLLPSLVTVVTAIVFPPAVDISLASLTITPSPTTAFRLVTMFSVTTFATSFTISLATVLSTVLFKPIVSIAFAILSLVAAAVPLEVMIAFTVSAVVSLDELVIVVDELELLVLSLLELLLELPDEPELPPEPP